MMMKAFMEVKMKLQCSATYKLQGIQIICPIKSNIFTYKYRIFHKDQYFVKQFNLLKHLVITF